MGSLEADYQLVRTSAGAAVADRDVVRAAGADAELFLQGQLSQDIAALEPGAAAWSFVLQPEGKVDVLLRVSRLSADEFVLDTDEGFGERLITRLDRFRLRVDCALEPLDWVAIALRGPDVAALELTATILARAPGRGIRGVDLLGPEIGLPAGVAEVSPEALEVLRVEAGWPRMGRELDDTTIPAEAGVVADTVSFTKGCYVGQELVARIDSRGGNVPRHLRGLRSEMATSFTEGESVSARGLQAGTVTSCAVSPRLGPVALAYVHRSVEPPTEVVVGDGAEARAAELVELPLVS